MIVLALLLIRLSRFLPWPVIRPGGCAFGDGGGCTQYAEMAITTFGKAAFGYVARLSGDCWHEHPDR